MNTKDNIGTTIWKQKQIRSHLDNAITCKGNANGIDPIRQLAPVVCPWETFAYPGAKDVIPPHHHRQIVLPVCFLDLLVDQGVMVVMRPKRLEIVILGPVWIEAHLNCAVLAQALIQRCLGNVHLRRLDQGEVSGRVVDAVHVERRSKVVVG